MISVAEALEHVFGLVTPLGSETVPLRLAAGRVLAQPAVARRPQPPFASAVMDGYVISEEAVAVGRTFRVIGEAAAGHAFEGPVGAGEAVRIFTGAPIPEGGRRVLIQEDVRRHGSEIALLDGADNSQYIRRIGADFNVGDGLAPGRRLAASDLALLAAMNIPDVKVYRRPTVALMATGDELVMPGDEPKPSQIIASNIFGLAAMVEAEGGVARVLPIARDTIPSLDSVFALAAGADLVLSTGGASVGDHDLVGKAAQTLGMEQAFYKVAMRPGKPLMAGRLNGSMMLGLPGNPVSAMVCGHIFMRPALRAFQGLPAAPMPRRRLPLAHALAANGTREHYMRARVREEEVQVFSRQDSALLSVLSDANALVVRPKDAPAAEAGEFVHVIDL